METKQVRSSSSTLLPDITFFCSIKIDNWRNLKIRYQGVSESKSQILEIMGETDINEFELFIIACSIFSSIRPAQLGEYWIYQYSPAELDEY